MIKNFDAFLTEEFATLGQSKVLEAMGYSLFSKGKRLRVLMLLTLLKDFGIDEEKGYYGAAALECIHTYSLIHDDLPALDNDDVRRFKPTNHIVYGEAFAILAGDGLLTLAFYLLSKGNYKMEVVNILSYYAGVNGMILGQEYDILDAINSLEELEQCYALKTGALFASGLKIAGSIANYSDLEALETIAFKLGIAFQHQDDLLEVIADHDIGKSTTSDADREKATILRFLELDKATEYVNTMFNDIYNAIENLNFKSSYFIDLVKSISNRSL